MRRVEESNKKNIFSRAYIYTVKGLSTFFGFTIAILAFVSFLSVAMLIGIVCGLCKAVRETISNFKELKDRFFTKQDNILDYALDTRDLQELKNSMDVSKKLQDYLSINNVDDSGYNIANPRERLLEPIDVKPRAVKLSDKEL